MKDYWQKALRIALVIFLLSWGLSFITSILLPSGKAGFGNIAHIPVHGPIFVGDGFSGFARGGVSSTDIIDFIDEAMEDDGIEGILLDINSPGGSPVASAEIGNALKAAHKPTVAWIRDVGASGGYWIASATDYIVANPMSITGSIGVFASYLEFSELLEQYNVTYQRMISGKYKDLGTPLKELTPVEEALFQEKLDKIHWYFKQEIMQNRDLTEAEVDAIGTGLIYLGSEALDAGLIDELGGKEEAMGYFEALNITPELVTYLPEVTVLDLLTSMGTSIGFGLGESKVPLQRSNTQYFVT